MVRKKNQYRNEECTLALQSKKKKHIWYIDSGCSKHMTGDRDSFLTLRKERNGSVSFEMIIQPKSLDKEQSELGKGIKRHKMFCW